MNKIFVVLFAFSLGACSYETVYSVDELVKDDVLYKKVQIKCKSGDYSVSSENCRNLQKAADKRKATGGDFPEWG